MPISNDSFPNNAVMHQHGELLHMFQQLNDSWINMSKQFWDRSNSNSSGSTTALAKDLSEHLQVVMKNVSCDPQRLIEEQMQLMQQQMLLWQRTALKYLGQEAEPVIVPKKSDRRFLNEEWQNNILFDFLKQSYLLQSQCFLNILKDQQSPSEDPNLVEFIGRQFVNALSPSNFAWTNPEVLEKTRDTQGQNLINGFKQLCDDISQSSSGLNVSMTDKSAFSVGDNVATTPGSIVFENEIFQLIQYSPTTDQVNETPLLIIPPFINKYYILDLGEKKSLVKWLVDQGHTVFMMSWVNAGPSHKNVTFDDYLTKGTLEAIHTIQKITNVHSVNTMAYCVGGTLLACTMAYLADKNLDYVKSSTYLTTLLDFSDPGEIGVFISEEMIQALEKEMREKGYFDGRTMAFSFNLLRENDLFWSFYINNYLKGETPKPFDLLYWNTDSTNLPGDLHGFYLRNMYLYNALKEPGQLEIAGVQMDLSKITTPSFFLSTIQDHIAKWKSTFSGMKLLSGEKSFVLSGSGHIAGVVNPPAANKYGYWENNDLLSNPEQWYENASHTEGSWWPRWQKWVESVSGDNKVEQRQPGSDVFPVIEPAPGRYVAMSINEAIAS